MAGSSDESLDDDLTAQTGGAPSGAVIEQAALTGHRRWWRRSPELLTLITGVIALTVVFFRHRSSDETYLVRRWSLSGADWLLLLAAVVLLAVVVVPLLRRPRRTKRLLLELIRRPRTALAVGVVLVITALSGWVVVERYIAQIPYEVGIFINQPPVGLSVSSSQIVLSNCAGDIVSSGPRETFCQGSWQFPLGTDGRGQPLEQVVLSGSRPVVYAVGITIGLIVPLAVMVGVTAGYYGGLIDDLLMAYVDFQLSVPAVLVYLIAYIFIANNPFVFILAFGLLSWGSIARLIRSETLKQRERGFVTSARAIGASDLTIIRRHILPNITNSVIPAAFHLSAVIILTEAGLSFLGFSAFDQSWGLTIGDSLQNQSGTALDVWWVATFPAAALALTVAALKVAGDGLRDVADPKGGPEHE